MIEDAIFSQVTTNAGVAALIAARLYPNYDQQSDQVYPLAVYKIENVASQMASDGPTGLMSAEIIIACIAPTKAVAGQVAAAMQAALDGTAGTWAGVRVQGCFLKDDGIDDDVVTETSTEAIVFYVKRCSFEIKYSL